MATEARGSIIRPRRPRWVVTPLESIGPLSFGMSLEEVKAALPAELGELGRFKAEPHSPQILGVQFGYAPAEPAARGYFDESGQLFCVATDAAIGPLVSLDSIELTARIPAELEQFLLYEVSWPAGLGVSYGPRGGPGVNGWGLVIRLQDVGAEVLTRPVVVGRKWAERCTDDHEGAVPVCEWIGRQWPYSGYADHWPSPDAIPPYWRDWTPPF